MSAGFIFGCQKPKKLQKCEKWQDELISKIFKIVPSVVKVVLTFFWDPKDLLLMEFLSMRRERRQKRCSSITQYTYFKYIKEAQVGDKAPDLSVRSGTLLTIIFKQV